MKGAAMRGRRKEATNRANELREQAREKAEHGGEALKAFAEETGVAAKDFAGKAKEAAKEFVDAIEKAAKSAGETPEPKRGRKFLKLIFAVGAGIAIFSNDRARSALSSVLGRSADKSDQPEVWRPEPSTSTNGGNATAAAIAEETS
jgi:hypothetical protein